MGAVTLPNHGSVALDSAPLIYVVERHPIYFPLIAPLWKAAEDGEITLVISELAISEALVHPLRTSDRTMLQAYELVMAKPGIRVESVTWPILHRAAEFRASRLGLRMPDAIHVATADRAGCDAFVTNDKGLRSVDLPQVIVLDDLV